MMKKNNNSNVIDFMAKVEQKKEAENKFSIRYLEEKTGVPDPIFVFLIQTALKYLARRQKNPPAAELLKTVLSDAVDATNAITASKGFSIDVEGILLVAQKIMADKVKTPPDQTLRSSQENTEHNTVLKDATPFDFHMVYHSIGDSNYGKFKKNIATIKRFGDKELRSLASEAEVLWKNLSLAQKREIESDIAKSVTYSGLDKKRAMEEMQFLESVVVYKEHESVDKETLMKLTRRWMEVNYGLSNIHPNPREISMVKGMTRDRVVAEFAKKFGNVLDAGSIYYDEVIDFMKIQKLSVSTKESIELVDGDQTKPELAPTTLDPSSMPDGGMPSP